MPSLKKRAKFPALPVLRAYDAGRIFGVAEMRGLISTIVWGYLAGEGALSGSLLSFSGGASQPLRSSKAIP